MHADSKCSLSTESEYVELAVEVFSMLADATRIPVQELAQRTGELDREARWFVYCEHGVRSVAACEFLTSAGFGEITNIRGGMAYWASKGLPYVQGP